MDSEPRRKSAVIYSFPPGGRAALRGKPPEQTSAVASVPSGRGWYHDVAIRDAGIASETKPRS